jgi:3-hydroxymyristoyl/3-hydroxydecanoyl-(acyl carrier protein) dehydratase
MSDRWTHLDEIVELGDGRARAFRNVTNTLAIFETHFPRFPVLPGVLVLGSIGRLAGELLAAEQGGPLADGGRRAGGVPPLRAARGSARARGPVHSG